MSVANETSKIQSELFRKSGSSQFCVLPSLITSSTDNLRVKEEKIFDLAEVLDLIIMFRRCLRRKDIFIYEHVEISALPLVHAFIHDS